MLSNVSCSTLSNFSPRGNSDISKKSRYLLGHIKNGNITTIRNAAILIKSPICEILKDHLNNNVTLVPVPRSTPLVDGALWPTKIIAEIFVNQGLGSEVQTYLTRIAPVTRSGLIRRANQRPSVHEHYNSISCAPNLICPENITLIDDVLTLGRTTFACAQRVHDIFPDSTIRVFTVMRTMGLILNINSFVEPRVGAISFNNQSGKTTVKI